MEELTLEKFEEASEIVKQVTLETKLIYSEYFSAQTGNKVYQHPDRRRKGKRPDHSLCRKPCTGRCLCCKAGWC